MRRRCEFWLADPVALDDAALYSGNGRYPLPAARGRPYCGPHEAIVWQKPGEPWGTRPPEAAPATIAEAVALPPADTAPAEPEAPAPACARRAPRTTADGRTRADVVRAMLALPEGMTVAELHAAFVEAFGACGATTAQQALFKLPVRLGWGKPENLGPRPGRGRGSVFRLPA